MFSFSLIDEHFYLRGKEQSIGNATARDVVSITVSDDLMMMFIVTFFQCCPAEIIGRFHR
jgi:hypothetical protein